jgi:hypothetical protein
MSTYPDERRSADYWAQVRAEYDRLDMLLGRIAEQQADGTLTPQQGLDQHVIVLTAALDALERLRRGHSGSGGGSMAGVP